MRIRAPEGQGLPVLGPCLRSLLKAEPGTVSPAPNTGQGEGPVSPVPLRISSRWAGRSVPLRDWEAVDPQEARQPGAPPRDPS